MSKRYRDTITGRFISRMATMLRPPGETVSETVASPLVVTDTMVDAAFHDLQNRSTDWWDGGGYPDRDHVRTALEAALKEAS